MSKSYQQRVHCLIGGLFALAASGSCLALARGGQVCDKSAAWTGSRGLHMIHCGQSCRAGTHSRQGLRTSVGGCAALWTRHAVKPSCIHAALQQAIRTSVGARIDLVLPPPPVQWFVLCTAAAPNPILAVQAVACNTTTLPQRGPETLSSHLHHSNILGRQGQAAAHGRHAAATHINISMGP